MNRAGWIVFSAVFVFALLVLNEPIRQFYISFAYDQRPVMSDMKCIMETPRIPVGGRLYYRCQYTKRPGCKGTGEYRLIGFPKSSPNVRTQYTFHVNISAGWPAVTNGTIRQQIDIPPNIPAGKYDMTWIFNYNCEASGAYGASYRPLQSKLPNLAIEIY